MRKRSYYYKISFKVEGGIAFIEGAEDIFGQSFKVAKKVLLTRVSKRERVERNKLRVITFERLDKDGNAIV